MRPSILCHRTEGMQRENQLINELIKIIVIRLRGSFRQQARSWNGKSLSRRNQLNEMKFHSPSILLSSSVFHSLRFLFSFSPLLSLFVGRLLRLFIFLLSSVGSLLGRYCRALSSCQWKQLQIWEFKIGMETNCRVFNCYDNVPLLWSSHARGFTIR